MFQRILVPVDGSDPSRHALDAALQLARDGGARLRIVHLFDALDHLTGFEAGAQALDAARAQAARVVEAAVATARSAGIAADGQLLDLPGLRLGEAIAQEVQACGADLVAVGSVGRRGVGRALLGSGAEQVLRHAGVPVLVVPARPGAGDAATPSPSAANAPA